MGEVSYRPLIEDMVWSYSRLETFCDCPYRWFLKYIKRYDDEDKFYASYGLFMHKLLEGFYKGKLSKSDMLTRFLLDFSKEVRGVRPQASTVEKYIQCGVEYLKGFEPFRFNMVDVEKKVQFDLGGIPFVGFIDYLGEEDGEYIIVDNKSRDLKPRSKRATPTVKDKELDSMLRQLYIYAAAIKQEYGKFPKLLCFNCFRTGTFIEEPFDEDTYNETVEWAKKLVEEIKDEDEFSPNREFFSCYYICGVSTHCCYDQMERDKRRVM